MKPTRIWIALLLGLGATASLLAEEKLTLARCQSLALENHIALRNSRLETAAAREAKKAAFTKFFPSLSVAGAVFQASEPLLEITSPGGNLPVYDGNPASLAKATQFAYFPPSTTAMLGKGGYGLVSAVQPVYAGGRIVTGNRLALLGIEVGETRQRLTQSEITLAIEEQYWQIVALDQKLKTVARFEELLTRLREKVESGYEAGLATKNEVLKVGLKLSALLVDKTKLQNGRNVALMALCQFIGLPYDPGFELEPAPLPQGNPEEIRVDHAAALERRPERKLLDAAVRSEALLGRLKLGEFRPQAAIGAAGLFLKNGDARGKTNAIVYATLSIPLSGVWEASYVRQERKIREKMAGNTLRDRSEAMVIQMEKTWQDLADAGRLVRVSQEALTQAEENLKVNQDSYENGLSEISDLLEAQVLRQQALDQVTDAAVAYRTRRARYLQATGRR